MNFNICFLITIIISFNTFVYGANFTDAQLDNACKKARAYNQKGQITEGYLEFSKLGDSYAEAAAKIFDSSKDTLERCVIQAHWSNVVDEKTKDKYFDKYGKQYQSNYIELVCKDKKLPKTDRIEKLYGDTLVSMGLPEALSIDMILNRQPRDSGHRAIQNLFCNIMTGRGLNYSEGEWYDAIALGKDRSRVAANQNKADVSELEADRLAFKTSMKTGFVSLGCAKTIALEFTKASCHGAAKYAHDVLTKAFSFFGSSPSVAKNDSIYDGILDKEKIQHHQAPATQDGSGRAR